MHLTTLKKLLEQNSVLKINKLFESKFDVTLDVNGVKKKFVEDFCAKNGYKICESTEDAVLAMMSKDSDEAIDYLAEQGYVVVPSKSRVINEYRAREGKVISEDKVQVIAIDSMLEKRDPNDKRYPYFKKIPIEQHDLACPYCNAVMREKDFSFKYDQENKCWIHNCKPDARILMEP